MNHLKNTKKINTAVLSEQLLQFNTVTIRYSKREWCFVFIAFILLCLFCCYLLTVGTYSISTQQFIHLLFNDQSQPIVERVVLHIRMPRIITALFVGMALAISGSVFQSVSKNALGSPDIIGFTTGAATGALIQIILFQGSGQQVMISALIGGIITSFIVYILARKSGVIGGYRLILIGIGIGSILSAINSLMLVKGNLDQAIMANLWLAGSLHARTWEHAVPVMIGVVILAPIIIYKSRVLNLLEMGDDMAYQLGISVEKERLAMIFLAVALAALATGAAGPISFIALAAPQLAVRILRTGQLSIAASAVIGGGLVLLADLVSQIKPLGLNLPIGQITSLVGGIYLLWLLTRLKNL